MEKRGRRLTHNHVADCSNRTGGGLLRVEAEIGGEDDGQPETAGNGHGEEENNPLMDEERQQEERFL